MSGLMTFKDIFTVSIILSLFMVGLFITLKSGVVSVSTDRSQLIMGNLSRTVVALAGCLVFLMMVQQIVGFRISSRW